jgi:hypothetical protein
MGADASFVSAELFDKQITDFSIDSRSVKTGEPGLKWSGS